MERDSVRKDRRNASVAHQDWINRDLTLTAYADAEGLLDSLPLIRRLEACVDLAELEHVRQEFISERKIDRGFQTVMAHYHHAKATFLCAAAIGVEDLIALVQYLVQCIRTYSGVSEPVHFHKMHSEAVARLGTATVHQVRSSLDALGTNPSPTAVAVAIYQLARARSLLSVIDSPFGLGVDVASTSIELEREFKRVSALVPPESLAKLKARVEEGLLQRVFLKDSIRRVFIVAFVVGMIISAGIGALLTILKILPA